MFFFQFQSNFVDDVTYQYTDVHPFHVDHVGGFVHARQYRYVTQQPAQTITLCITTFKESVHFLPWNIIIVDDCFQIPLDTADRCFQFVGNVLRQLAFQAHLFFFLSDIVDRNLETGILEDNTFYDKCPSVLINSNRHPLLIFTERTLLLVLVYKMDNLFQLTDCKYLFRRFQVRVGNQIAVLGKEIVDQNLLFVFREYP